MATAPPRNFAFPNFVPGKHKLPPDFKLYPDTQATLPTTPPIPATVNTGDIITAAHENTVTTALSDLWTNEQWIAANMLNNPTTTKGDLLVNNGSGLARLGVGADNYRLTADSTQALGLKWGPADPMLYKGDLIARGASASARLPVGADGTVLMADSTQALGIKWATGGVNTVFGRSGNVVAQAGDYTASQITGAVGNTTQIIAGAGMTGGGALTGNVTLNAAVTSVFGRTGAVVLTTGDLTGAGGVPATRQILAGLGMTGGGDLTADRTIAGVVFGASGTSHSAGLVPDPGASPGASRFLCENGAWAVPAGGSGGGGQNQSPWLSDIDASYYTLTNLRYLAMGSAVVQAAPAVGIQVAGSSGATGITVGEATASGAASLNFNNDSTSAAIKFAGSTGAPAANALAILNNSSNGPIIFGTQASEDMRISAAGFVGIAKAAPAYPLDVTGDVNCTGTYRVNGSPLAAAQIVNAVDQTQAYANPSWITGLAYSKLTGVPSVGSYQTPWLQHINAAGYMLMSAGNIGIGNDASVTPDGVTQRVQMIVGNTTTVGGNYSGVTIANNTTGAPGEVGALTFANYNITAAEKRTALIQASLIGGATSGALLFWTMNAGAIAERMRILNTGNIGIGNSALTLPEAGTTKQFLIVGPTGATIPGVDLVIANYSTTATSGEIGQLAFANYGIAATEKRMALIQGIWSGANNSGAMAFFTNNAGAVTERMRITQTGFTGIGTSGPVRALHVSRLVAGGEGAVLMLDNPGGGTGSQTTVSFSDMTMTQPQMIMLIGLNDGSYSSHLVINVKTPGATGNGMAERFRLASNGNLGLAVTSPTYQLQLSTDSAAKPGTNTWTIASDGRLKRRIRDFRRGLETLLRFRPVEYEYNGEGGMPEGLEGVGLVAQEAERVYPQCVRKAPGQINGEDTEVLWTNTSDLAYMMLNALREINARLELLEGR